MIANRQFGRYSVIDVILTSGVDIVYSAHDPSTGQKVAIKTISLLNPPKTGDTEGPFRGPLSNEMRIRSNLQHKNIAAVYECGDQDGYPYLVMEDLDGEPLSRLISERRFLSLIEKLNLAIQVCKGLQYAHDRNIIHRDVKPAIVIVQADGTVKIVDFACAGIGEGESAIIEQKGLLVGSLSYLSPEQFESMVVDARSDVFSTGVMLYQLLTYELPFAGTDATSTVLKILREDPKPLSHYGPEFPLALQHVISKALAKRIADRYSTAEEFGSALLRVEEELRIG